MTDATPRIVFVGASADWSTIDVSNGYRDALRAAGAEVHEVKFNRRIINMGGFLGLEPSARNLVQISRHASRSMVPDAIEFEPDWVLIISAMAFHPDAVVLLKRAGLRVGVIFTESPYSDPDMQEFASLCDFVATNDRHSAEKYGWLHLPAAYNPDRHHLVDVAGFNLAKRMAWKHETDEWAAACDIARATFEPTSCLGCKRSLPGPVLPDSPEEPWAIPQHDVVLVGTGWAERVTRLKQVDWTGIDFAIYGCWPQLDDNRDNLDYEHAAGITDDEEGREKLGRYYTKLPTENDQTVALYSGAKIVLNDHRDHPDAYSCNPRVYEALAVGGGLLLTDYRPEIKDLLGDLWPHFVFNSPGELQALIHYFIEHEDERQRLVKYGQERVRQHTFAERTSTLLRALEAATVREEVSVG